MKYRMYIRETNFGIAEVEADSPEEAEKLAEHYYFNGKVQWESTRLDCDTKPYEGSGLDE